MRAICGLFADLFYGISRMSYCISDTNLYLVLDLLFLGGNLGSGVGEANVEFFGTSNDSSSLSGRDVGCNFTRIDSVVHQEKFEVGLVGDEESLETVSLEESGSLGSSVSDADERLVSSELSSHSVIDTSWSSVAIRQSGVEVRGKSSELCGSLVHASLSKNWFDAHFIRLYL